MMQQSYWIFKKPREGNAKRCSTEPVNNSAMCHRSVIYGFRLALGIIYRLEPIIINLSQKILLTR